MKKSIIYSNVESRTIRTPGSGVRLCLSICCSMSDQSKSWYLRICPKKRWSPKYTKNNKYLTQPKDRNISSHILRRRTRNQLFPSTSKNARITFALFKLHHKITDTVIEQIHRVLHWLIPHNYEMTTVDQIRSQFASAAKYESNKSIKLISGFS